MTVMRCSGGSTLSSAQLKQPTMSPFARTAIRKAGEVRPYAADKIKWWAKMKNYQNGEVSMYLAV